MADDSNGSGPVKDLGRGDVKDTFDAAKELDEQEELRRHAKKKEPIQDPVREITESSNIRESVRDVVMGELEPVLGHADVTEQTQAEEGIELVKKRRRELHELLDNLGDELEGKSPQEVAAVLSSFLDIASQLSLEKTEGVITVRCRLASFFYDKNSQTSVPPQMRQEVNLIFSPEEVEAIRLRLENTPDDDTMKPFFTTVLDQAFDVVQYNEMTGMVLIEMTKYFLGKLEEHGYGTHTKYAEFTERHDRTMVSLDRALQELRDAQVVINSHFKRFPVLQEFPKALRLLIHVRLGMLPQSTVPKLVEAVRQRQASYSRARSSVAFDFKRLPSYQHGVQLRQSAILNLHKDVLKFTGEQLEGEFALIQQEFENLMAEIEAASETLEPNSPEYEAMMRQKEKLQMKIGEQRRKLNVLRSQERLIDVQRTQVRASIERYKESDLLAQKTQEHKEQAKIKAATAPQPTKPKKKISRMVTATLRDGR